MGVLETSDHIHINIKMLNPIQEPAASSKAPNQNLKDMDILCTFKIKIDIPIWSMGITNTKDHIHIKINMPNPSQEPPASYKVPNEDLKNVDVLCTFKIQIECQNSDQGCIKDQ